VETGSASEYREHLQYLADQDEERTHGNYALVRFVIWVSPVLGFLGTVVHFGTALSGISIDEMAERLPHVVNEMGAAFNTTTVALASATTMMFSVFVCERTERGIVRTVDRLVDRELLNRFEVRQPAAEPFLAVVQSANEAALAALTGTLERQREAWNAALDGLFVRFDERQEQEWKCWQTVLDALQRRQEAYDVDREQRFEKLVATIESRQNEHLGQLFARLEDVAALKEDFAGFVAALQDMSRGEQHLVDLQSTLSDNLRALRETQQIDDALHGLTAAIHLLTTRHRLVAAPEPVAA
jgi:hypothetical protein